MDLVDWADRHGISRLYLDEVHRYEGWSQALKNIYDDYPDMSIVYTSSSLLVLDNATVDMSRRQTPVHDVWPVLPRIPGIGRHLQDQDNPAG